jgi:hypothetical protein
MIEEQRNAVPVKEALSPFEWIVALASLRLHQVAAAIPGIETSRNNLEGA